MRFKMTLEVVLLVLGLTSYAHAAPSNNDARAYAEKYFASKWIQCPSQLGTRHFVLLGGKSLTELSKPWLEVTASGLSDADELNHIDFSGQVQLRMKAFRVFNSEAGGWHDWEVEDPKLLAFGFPSRLFDYSLLVEHKDGKWRTLNNEVENTASLDCSQAHFFESASPAAAVPAKPFKANAVLTGDLLSTKCPVPKGTQIMVTGLAFAFSEADPGDSAVIDPAVCPSNTTLNVPEPLIKALPGSEVALAWLREPQAATSRPFTPNDHLNRDFEVKALEGSCFLSKGTAVEDLGPFENWRKLYQEPMERIILPPDACHNLPPSHNLVLPVSVLEAKSAEAATVRVAAEMQIAPTQRTQSFTPNGMLLREWRWGSCVFPKGTRLQDLGHEENLPASMPVESVIMDPAAGCLPARGSGGPIGVSKSWIAATP